MNNNDNQRNCSDCITSSGDDKSYHDEPLCPACAEAERTDGTPEAQVEQYARDANLSPLCNHFVVLDDVVYEVSPFCDGRDWTAAWALDTDDDIIKYEATT